MEHIVFKSSDLSFIKKILQNTTLNKIKENESEKLFRKTEFLSKIKANLNYNSTFALYKYCQVFV